MASSSIVGTTTGSVSIPTSSTTSLAAAQSVVSGVSALIASGSATVVTATSSISPTTPTVLQVGGSTPTAAGVVNLGTLNANVTAVLINNVNTTTAANTTASTNQSVVGGTGGLVFTDAGTSTNVVVGGGTNTIVLSATSKGAVFTGDGTNTLTIGATGGTTTIKGTSASVDSIQATSGGSVAYTASSGAAAVVQATSGNVTIVGTVGATQTVFGGSGQTIVSDGAGGFKTLNVTTTFTGSLTAVNIQGYAEGGSGGSNTISANTTGSSTLVGGGSGDTLVAGGVGDQLVARARGGFATLDGSQTAGGVNLWADVNGNNTSSGAVVMFGSQSQADNFYLSTSTLTGTSGGVTFKGSLITLHHNASGTLLNTTVNNQIDVGVFNNFAQFATVTDFISGHDKLVVGQGQGAVTISQSGGNFIVSTAQGSTITVQGTISLTDITRI